MSKKTNAENELSKLILLDLQSGISTFCEKDFYERNSSAIKFFDISSSLHDTFSVRRKIPAVAISAFSDSKLLIKVRQESLSSNIRTDNQAAAPDRRLQRTPETEAQIFYCAALAESDLRRELKGDRLETGEAWRDETLVYLIRTADRNGNVDLREICSRKFYEKNVNRIWHLAKRFLPPETVDDAAGETWTKMFTQILQPTEASHKFWEERFGLALKMLTLDVCKKHWRAGKNDFVSVDADDADRNAALEIETPALLPVEDLIFIGEAISRLAEPTRRIFVWFHGERMTQEEIGKLLEMTTRNVRYHLAKADKVLARWRGGEKN